MKEFLDKFQQKKLTLLIKGKLDGQSMDSFNMDNRIKYYVSKVIPQSLKNDNENLISILNTYSGKFWKL